MTIISQTFGERFHMPEEFIVSNLQQKSWTRMKYNEVHFSWPQDVSLVHLNKIASNNAAENRYHIRLSLSLHEQTTHYHLHKSLISWTVLFDMMAIVSPDGAAEHEDEHDVRPLDVEEARRLGAASEHSPGTEKC